MFIYIINEYYLHKKHNIYYKNINNQVANILIQRALYYSLGSGRQCYKTINSFMQIFESQTHNTKIITEFFRTERTNILHYFYLVQVKLVQQSIYKIYQFDSDQYLINTYIGFYVCDLVYCLIQDYIEIIMFCFKYTCIFLNLTKYIKTITNIYLFNIKILKK